MKTLFVALVTFLFALIIGCQESSITDPVSNDTGTNSVAQESIYMDKDISSYYPGVIKLDGLLPDPSHFLNSFARIKGMVRYRMDEIKINDLTTSPPNAVSVKLFVSAQLFGESPKPVSPWIVTGTSADVMVYTHNGLANYVLEKSFRVRNTSLNLILKFRVYDKSVKLTSMTLKKVDDSVQIPDPTM
jgi:hypothetical protein